MSRLVICGKYYGAEQPFLDMFNEHAFIYDRDWEGMTVPLKSTDVVLLGGGEDIAPSLYNQRPSKYCGKNELSRRDIFEAAVFNQAVKVGAKILGICRGAQLICAMSGGSLVQHVTNHHGRHEMTTKDGKTMEVSSVHHQMMNPFSIEHDLIGWAQDSLSSCYLIQGEKNIEVPVEPEIVFFPTTKALAIQYHPEFMDGSEEAVKYSRELVKNYLLGE